MKWALSLILFNWILKIVYDQVDWYIDLVQIEQNGSMFLWLDCTYRRYIFIHIMFQSPTEISNMDIIFSPTMSNIWVILCWPSWHFFSLSLSDIEFRKILTCYTIFVFWSVLILLLGCKCNFSLFIALLILLGVMRCLATMFSHHTSSTWPLANNFFQMFPCIKLLICYSVTGKLCSHCARTICIKSKVIGNYFVAGKEVYWIAGTEVTGLLVSTWNGKADSLQLWFTTTGFQSKLPLCKRVQGPV